MGIGWKQRWNGMSRGRKVVGATALTVVIGLLLWARLIVVSDMPRTAIARPAPQSDKAAPDAGPTNVRRAPEIDPISSGAVSHERSRPNPDFVGEPEKSATQLTEDGH